MRKIAANYICLPGFPLVKNGYVILEQGRVKDVVDTGGRIREIQGLEFYGGLIVAAYVAAYQERLEEGDLLLPCWTRSTVGEEKSIRGWEFGKVPIY